MRSNALEIPLHYTCRSGVHNFPERNRGLHGNSLGQMVANHMPLGRLFFLIILIFLVNPLLGMFTGVGYRGLPH